jgi:hypothetical protein
MAQQTAVDWFADEILKAAIVFLYNEKNEGKFSLAYDELIEQAKQMEEEQHHNTWLDSRIENSDGYEYLGKEKTFEQYYNETYNTN